MPGSFVQLALCFTGMGGAVPLHRAAPHCDVSTRLAFEKTAFVDSKAVARVGKIGVLLLICLLVGSPVFACMLPGAVTTAEEAACCREMASDCGHADTPSSHSCCQTLSAPDQAAVAKGSFKLLQQLNPLYVVQPSFDSVPAVQRVLLPVAGIGHSPPETPPSSSAILRI